MPSLVTDQPAVLYQVCIMQLQDLAANKHTGNTRGGESHVKLVRSPVLFVLDPAA